jgi:hypothetical protein
MGGRQDRVGVRFTTGQARGRRLAISMKKLRVLRCLVLAAIIQ